jgi:hypothetical protein
MSKRAKPHKVRGRKLEEVRKKDPDGRIVVHHRTVDTLGKMLRAGTIDEAMHDAPRDFQAAFIVANLAGSAAGASDPPGAGTGSRPGFEQPPAPRSTARAQVAGGAGWHFEPGGFMRVACRRAAAEGPRVGDPAGLGRTAGARGAGAKHPGRRARSAGSALRVRRQVSILTTDAAAFGGADGARFASASPAGASV